MEEEPNEHELEERLYAMLHHVDETQTQGNVSTDRQNDAARFIENAPRSTVRRYWRTSADYSTQHQKTASKETAPPPANRNPTTTNTNNNTKPKQEKCMEPTSSIDLSLFQSPPQIVKKTIEILEVEPYSVELESSDEDEVIEVELPPKPTITIESSDEDEVCIVSQPEISSNTNKKNNTAPENNAPTADRAVSASPVPSVVSSVSDEFIRSDCIALNISSRHTDNHSFDFSLHGSDLLGQTTPSKKKKKKKSKEAATSTPVPAAADKTSTTTPETCFATPKSKAKNKKQKTKSYTVSEKSVPSADVYDSDSNQSVIETGKGTYVVTEKSLPSADVYESDSSYSENVNKSKSVSGKATENSDSSVSDKQQDKNETNNTKQSDTSLPYTTANSIVDLTDSEQFMTLDSTGITDDNIIMANVSGFQEPNNEEWSYNAPKLGSTKVPQILFDNLDFDNLKGKDTVCKRRRYSLTTLRAEMEKFYNESWGGEDFNHREIQKYMSRDKSLWVIDPKDRMPALSKRKITCNYCNRPGHRDDNCRMKPPVCFMCGNTGHYEPRCPSKICVNCGSPNHMYSTMCRNCASWGRVTCAECGQAGHPASHCPDVWRRYHNTLDTNMPLVENRQLKKNHQLYCSGCTRRGHLVHSCRLTLPFSGLPINSPYVALYRPVYPPQPHPPPRTENKNKRHSKSPTVHETHLNKKKNMMVTDIEETPEKTDERPRKNSQSKNQDDPKTPKTVEPPKEKAEPAPDFIPIASVTNRDKRGHIIQDNEVTDTSDVVTSARIAVSDEIVARLKAPDGAAWLEENLRKCNITMQNAEIASFLNIRGKIADQEAFHTELRGWLNHGSNKENVNSDIEEEIAHDIDENPQNNIPKNRNNLLRKLTKAFESLNDDLGDPKAIWNELNYLQNRHELLLKQKSVSATQLSNNRTHINEMLKKLNMVLLGQAGLADGPKHLSELQSLHEKVTNFRQKNVSIDLRKVIGQHYHTIFTAIPRNDYAELLKKYYVTKKQLKPKKNKMQKPQVGGKKRKKSRRGLMGPPQTGPNSETNANEGGNFVTINNAHSKNPNSVIGELALCHKKLIKTRPVDAILKKQRGELCRKLHSYISSCTMRGQISSKTLKKVRKIHHQAQVFLGHV
ncbi:uncharacterized protein LOC114366192 [Ostrinia furnacalis]|uniref:uncharacterized protein LOC114366192 n=1 Tax=Ostrinia furnacalis TaxID=93504 RepID=UPI00103E80E4|nr:uncharacterized protein LOC114366192 [Ostrinia furnacalis]